MPRGTPGSLVPKNEDLVHVDGGNPSADEKMTGVTVGTCGRVAMTAKSGIPAPQAIPIAAVTQMDEAVVRPLTTFCCPKVTRIPRKPMPDITSAPIGDGSRVTSAPSTELKPYAEVGEHGETSARHPALPLDADNDSRHERQQEEHDCRECHGREELDLEHARPLWQAQGGPHPDKCLYVLTWAGSVRYCERHDQSPQRVA